MRKVCLVVSAIASIVVVTVLTGRPPQGPVGMALYSIPGVIPMFFLFEPLLAAWGEKQGAGSEETAPVRRRRRSQMRREQHGPSGPVPDKRWWCRIGDDEVGPMDELQLQKLAAARTLSESDLVRHSESAEWRRAGEVLDELRQHAAAASRFALVDAATSAVSESSAAPADVSGEPLERDEAQTQDSDTYSLKGPAASQEGSATGSDVWQDRSDDTAGRAPVMVPEVDSASDLSSEQSGADAPRFEDGAAETSSDESERESNTFEGDPFRWELPQLILECVRFPLQSECWRTLLRMCPGWYCCHVLNLFFVFLAVGIVTATVQTVPELTAVPVVMLIAYSIPIVGTYVVMHTYLAACALDVFSHTADGTRVIGEYPEGTDVAELLRGFIVLCVLWTATLPAYFCCYGNPGMLSAQGILMWASCLFFAVPLIAVSTELGLESVLKSILEVPKRWLRFYLLAFGLGISATVFIWVSYLLIDFLLGRLLRPVIEFSIEHLGKWPTVAWVVLMIPGIWTVVSFIHAAAVLVYARLTGCFAWSLSEFSGDIPGEDGDRSEDA